MMRKRRIVVCAVDDQDGNVDAGRGGGGIDGIDDEMPLLFRAPKCRSMMSAGRKYARSLATVRKSAKDSALMTARTRLSVAAVCSATAAPSECPISTTRVAAIASITRARSTFSK